MLYKNLPDKELEHVLLYVVYWIEWLPLFFI